MNWNSYNEKQEELMYKEFKVNNKSSITRFDYESFPCPMIAFNWSDEQMEKLAKAIREVVGEYEDYSSDEGYEEEYWCLMENTAFNMGMGYYEDLTDEEVDKLNNEFKAIK